MADECPTFHLVLMRLGRHRERLKSSPLKILNPKEASYCSEERIVKHEDYAAIRRGRRTTSSNNILKSPSAPSRRAGGNVDPGTPVLPANPLPATSDNPKHWHITFRIYRISRYPAISRDIPEIASSMRLTSFRGAKEAAPRVPFDRGTSQRGEEKPANEKLPFASRRERSLGDCSAVHGKHA